jgi:short-subunit dehydrogenase
MSQGFADKTVWITGASSGIGRALAIDLDRRGARLVLSGRREAALAQTAAELSHPALVLAFEATDFDRLPAVVDEAIAWRSSGVDLLINNAGVSQRSLIVDTNFSVYRDLMEVDFFAPVRLTQLILPHMIERGNGHVAVISSIAGKVGVPLRGGYSAAKHAIFGWFDTLRAEVEKAYGINVSIIVPGSVQTEIAMSALSATGHARGRSDENIANGMPADEAARQIAEGLTTRAREILVAEGQEAQAAMLRAQQPELLFELVAEEGARLAKARADAGLNWQPEPKRIR